MNAKDTGAQSDDARLTPVRAPGRRSTVVGAEGSLAGNVCLRGRDRQRCHAISRHGQGLFQPVRHCHEVGTRHGVPGGQAGHQSEQRRRVCTRRPHIGGRLLHGHGEMEAEQHLCGQAICRRPEVHRLATRQRLQRWPHPPLGQGHDRQRAERRRGSSVRDPARCRLARDAYRRCPDLRVGDPGRRHVLDVNQLHRFRCCLQQRQARGPDVWVADV